MQGVTRIELRSLPYRIIYLLKKIIPSVVFPDDSFFFFRQFKKAVTRIGAKPDLIISRSAPYSSGVMAKLLASHYQVPWIMHLSDLWVDSPFFQLTEKEQNRHQSLEKDCIETATIVTLTAQKVIEFYQKKYPACSEKFKFLPNVFDPLHVNKMEMDFSSKLKIVFTGRLYGDRSIHSVVRSFEEAIARYPSLEDRLEITFAGFFDKKNVDCLNQSALGCFHYLGHISIHQARQLQHMAHVLLSIDALESDPKFDMFFPSKLLDYIAANAFVLCFTGENSTTHDVIDGVYGKCFSQKNLHQFPEFLNMLVHEFENKNRAFFRPGNMDNTYSASSNVNRLNGMITALVNE